MPVKAEGQTKTLQRVKTPKDYTCVIHNDDVTTMDFVVMAICAVFGKSPYDATIIMNYIHNNGSAAIGKYCYDIAITKKKAMDRHASEHGFPLQTTVEEWSATAACGG